MTVTCSGICYTMTKLSHYSTKSTMNPLIRTKQGLCYLKGTTHSLVFNKSNKPLSLRGFCDANWRKSKYWCTIIGYSFQLSSNSSIISWNARKQLW